MPAPFWPSNPPVQLLAARSDRQNRVEHGHDPALHVAGTASEQKILFADWMKLFRRLRRNHIVMSVEIQRPFSASVVRHQRGGTLLGLVSHASRADSFAFEIQLL